MVGIEGELVINRPVAEVFDFAAMNGTSPLQPTNLAGREALAQPHRPRDTLRGRHPGPDGLDDNRVPDLGAPRRLASFIDMAAGDIVGTLRFDRSQWHRMGWL
jgi:hypothetical protein